jgi:hypothetical protein
MNKIILTLVVLAVTTLALAGLAQGSTLKDNSTCFSWATSDTDHVAEYVVTSKGETAIELLVLSPDEEREIANGRARAFIEKIECIRDAESMGWVAFRAAGINRFFTTSPLNIVD